MPGPFVSSQRAGFFVVFGSVDPFFFFDPVRPPHLGLFSIDMTVCVLFLGVLSPVY